MKMIMLLLLKCCLEWIGRIGISTVVVIQLNVICRLLSREVAPSALGPCWNAPLDVVAVHGRFRCIRFAGLS